MNHFPGAISSAEDGKCRKACLISFFTYSCSDDRRLGGFSILSSGRTANRKPRLSLPLSSAQRIIVKEVPSATVIACFPPFPASICLSRRALAASRFFFSFPFDAVRTGDKVIEEVFLSSGAGSTLVERRDVCVPPFPFLFFPQSEGMRLLNVGWSCKIVFFFSLTAKRDATGRFRFVFPLPFFFLGSRRGNFSSKPRAEFTGKGTGVVMHVPFFHPSAAQCATPSRDAPSAPPLRESAGQRDAGRREDSGIRQRPMLFSFFFGGKPGGAVGILEG